MHKKKRLKPFHLFWPQPSVSPFPPPLIPPSLPTHMQLHPTYYPNVHTYTHPKPPRQWQPGGGGRWEPYKRVRDLRGRAEETSPSLTGSLPPPPPALSTALCTPAGPSASLTYLLAHVHSPHLQHCERLLWQQLRSVIPALLSQQHAAPGGFSGSDGGCVQRESSRRAPYGRQEPRPHQQGEQDSFFILVFIFEKLAKLLSFDLFIYLLYPEEFQTVVC